MPNNTVFISRSEAVREYGLSLYQLNQLIAHGRLHTLEIPGCVRPMLVRKELTELADVQAGQRVGGVAPIPKATLQLRRQRA